MGGHYDTPPSVPCSKNQEIKKIDIKFQLWENKKKQKEREFQRLNIGHDGRGHNQNLL